MSEPEELLEPDELAAAAFIQGVEDNAGRLGKEMTGRAFTALSSLSSFAAALAGALLDETTLPFFNNAP